MTPYVEKASYDWSEDSVRIISTPSTCAKMTCFYVQEVGYFKTVPPYFTERCGLPSFLIVYTISGSGDLMYENELFHVTEGQCFYLDCMKHHRYETAKDSGWEFLWVHFYGSSSVGYYEEYIRNGFGLVNISDSSFEQDFRKLIEINMERGAFHEYRTSNLILNLITELLILHSAGGVGMVGIPEYVRGVNRYIDTHFKEEISLKMLADLQHISKYHLSREFKKYNGITIQEYLINARITYAKELLKYSDLTVNEIAESCGVQNVSHFINLFKERESMTPLSYRKIWK